MAEEQSQAHLYHFKNALWIQAASAHLPHTGNGALVGDGDDEARHRAGLLLQSCVHHMSVAHLPKHSELCVASLVWLTAIISGHQQVSLPCTRSQYRERFLR